MVCQSKQRERVRKIKPGLGVSFVIQIDCSGCEKRGKFAFMCHQTCPFLRIERKNRTIT
jgi:hypothetical protein